MSYQLQQAYALTTVNNAWQTVTINPTGQTIAQLLALYNGLVLQLGRPGVNGDFYFDIKHNVSFVSNQGFTIAQWLTSLGDQMLPTVGSAPFRVNRYVNYRDAALANYSWRLAARDRHPDAGASDGELTDLVLNRQNTTYTDMAKYCLVSVNGLFHYTTAEPYGLRVHDAGSSAYVAGVTHIGIHSWAGLGDIELIPITPDRISRVDPTVPITDKARIDTGLVSDRKTVLLVMGGYLHVLDSVATRQGQSVIVDVKKLQLAQRVFDTLRIADLQDAVKDFTHEEGHWSTTVANLGSEEFIRAYLSVSQSFLVVVNTPILYVEKELVRNTELGGTYTSKNKPLYPLLGPLNKVSEYIPRKKGNDWLLYNYKPYYPNFKFLKSIWRKELRIEGSLVSNRPWLYHHAYYWKIYTETLSLVP